MAKLTDAQIRSLVERHFSGLGSQVVETMFRIAKAESGGDVSAVGDNIKSGHQKPGSKAHSDYGLMQISSQHPYDAKRLVSDPDYNMKAAREVYDRQGAKAWSTYPQVAREMGTNMAGPDDTKLTPEEIEQLARYSPGTPAPFSTSGLPTGYTYDQITGRFSKTDSDGRVVPASTEEVVAAAQAERTSTATATATPPSMTLSIDPSTGEAIWSNPRTGEIVRTGEIIGQPEVDARTKFLNEQAVQGFNAEIAKRQQAIDLLQSTQTNLITMARDADTGKVQRGQLKESARQANLTAAVDQYNTALGLIPQMGQLSIEESKQVGTILNSGGDYLARSFESRGGVSPLARVLQADQINALTSTINTLRAQVNTALAAGPVATDGYTEIDPYEAAVLPDQSGLPASPTFGLVALPAVPQVNGPRTVFGGASAGGPTDEYRGTPYVAPPSVDAAFGPVPVSAQGEPPAPDPAMQTNSPTFTVPSGFEPGAGVGGSGTGGGGGSWEPAYGSGLGVDEKVAGAAKGVFRAGGKVLKDFGKLLAYEDGGYTRDEAFVGNEKGAELFLNPTNAPIAIVDAETTKKIVKKGGVRGFEGGTFGRMMRVGGAIKGGAGRILDAVTPDIGRATNAPEYWQGPPAPYADTGLEGYPDANWELHDMARRVYPGMGQPDLDFLKTVRRADPAGPQARGKAGTAYYKYDTFPAQSESTEFDAGGAPTNTPYGSKNPNNIAIAFAENNPSESTQKHEIAHAMQYRYVPNPYYFVEALRKSGLDGGDFKGKRNAQDFLTGDANAPAEDAAHLYTNVAERYDFDISKMPESLRRFYPWLSPGEGPPPTGFRRFIRGFATGTGLQYNTDGSVYHDLTNSAYRALVPTTVPQPAPAPAPVAAAPTVPKPVPVPRPPVQARTTGFMAQPQTPRPAPISFPMTSSVTQKELVEMARRNSPPAIAALFGGTPLAPPTALKSTIPGEDVYMKTPTARQWLGLSEEDRKAASARANVEFNAGPGFFEDRLTRQYGSSGGRSKGFVGAMGL